MRTVTISKTLAAASANNIAKSQSLAGAGTFTLDGATVNGGIATLDTQRRVLITSAGDDSKITFSVYGGNESGSAIVQTVTGAAIGAAATTLDFLTVSKVSASGATAGAVTIGTSSTGSTPWYNPSASIAPFVLPIVTGVTGSVTYSVETTPDHYWTTVQASQATPIPSVQPTAIAGASTASNLTINAPVLGWRLTVTAGAGTVTATANQAGITNY